MKYWVFVAGTTALATALAVSAAAAPIKMQPGLWTISVDMKMAYHPRLQLESVLKRCIKPEDSAEGRFIPKLETRPGMSCMLKNFSRQGDTATYTRVCTGTQGSTTSRGTITFSSPTMFEGKVKTTGMIRGRHIDTTRKLRAKRVGDCSQ